MFEVEDLEVASPATVSRCGMVYMESDSLGYRPIFDSFIEFLHENIKNLKNDLVDLFEYFVPPILKQLESLSKYIDYSDNPLVSSLCKII